MTVGMTLQALGAKSHSAASMLIIGNNVIMCLLFEFHSFVLRRLIVIICPLMLTSTKQTETGSWKKYRQREADTGVQDLH